MTKIAMWIVVIVYSAAIINTAKTLNEWLGVYGVPIALVVGWVLFALMENHLNSLDKEIRKSYRGKPIDNRPFAERFAEENISEIKRFMKDYETGKYGKK